MPREVSKFTVTKRLIFSLAPKTIILSLKEVEHVKTVGLFFTVPYF